MFRSRGSDPLAIEHCRDVAVGQELLPDHVRAEALDKPQANADGSYDPYFGPKAPAGKEGMWVKTIPGKGWFSAFRIYGPQAPAFDGTWKLNDIERLK